MMIRTNVTGGILKQEANKQRGASWAMSIDDTASQPSLTTRSESAMSWMKWMALLQPLRSAIPTV